MRRVVSIAVRVLLAALLALLVTSSVASPAHADPGGGAIAIEAALVRASRSDPHVDPALQAFASDLRALPYNHFVLVKRATWSAGPGKRAEGRVGDVRVVVQVDHADASGVTMQVEVYRGDRRITSTTVSRPFGRAHVVSAGNEGGDVLLVPIRAVR